MLGLEQLIKDLLVTYPGYTVDQESTKDKFVGVDAALIKRDRVLDEKAPMYLNSPSLEDVKDEDRQATLMSLIMSEQMREKIIIRETGNPGEYTVLIYGPQATSGAVRIGGNSNTYTELLVKIKPNTELTAAPDKKGYEVKSVSVAAAQGNAQYVYAKEGKHILSSEVADMLEGADSADHSDTDPLMPKGLSIVKASKKAIEDEAVDALIGQMVASIKAKAFAGLPITGFQLNNYGTAHNMLFGEDNAEFIRAKANAVLTINKDWKKYEAAIRSRLGKDEKAKDAFTVFCKTLPVNASPSLFSQPARLVASLKTFVTEGLPNNTIFRAFSRTLGAVLGLVSIPIDLIAAPFKLVFPNSTRYLGSLFSIPNDGPIDFVNRPLNSGGSIAYSVNKSLELSSLERRIGIAKQSLNAQEDPVVKACVKSLESYIEKKRFSGTWGGLVSGLREMTGALSSNRTENKELHLAAIDMVLSSKIGTCEIGGCQSAKDRYGAVRILASAYKAYAEKYNELPPAFGSKEFKDLTPAQASFLKSQFTQAWFSGIGQEIAARNTEGATGLKNNTQILTKDHQLAIREELVSQVKVLAGKHPEITITAELTDKLNEYAGGKAGLAELAGLKDHRFVHLAAFDPPTADKLAGLNKYKVPKVKATDTTSTPQGIPSSILPPDPTTTHAPIKVPPSDPSSLLTPPQRLDGETITPPPLRR